MKDFETNVGSGISDHRLKEAEEHLLGWRMRCYFAEKWLSRLLGIGLNQAVREAEKRVNHPLGFDEKWDGTPRGWRMIDVLILKGAVARLEANIQAMAESPRECRCADCRGVEIDLDCDPPDIRGRDRVDGGGYTKVSSDGGLRA
jgi:hypothetical protein